MRREGGRGTNPEDGNGTGQDAREKMKQLKERVGPFKRYLLHFWEVFFSFGRGYRHIRAEGETQLF